MIKIQRVPTGIKGFDELVDGGIPKGTCILITGSPGTAKTLFCLEYLFNGLTKFKEKGLYVTVGQSVEVLKKQAAIFGWDFDTLSKKGFDVMSLSTKQLDGDIASIIMKKVKDGGYKRLVIDSLTTLSLNAPLYRSINDVSVADIMKNRSLFSPPVGGESIIQSFVYNFIDSIHQLNDCTTILVSESSEKGEYLTRDQVSEFVSDGIILLTFESMGGEFSRSLLVRKMRQTNNDEDVHPLEISPKGLVIHNIK